MNAAAFAIPALLVGIVLFGVWRRIDVFEAFIEGANEGLLLVVRIVPYIIAIYLAIGLFRDSGALDMLTAALGPVLTWLGIPGPILPVLLVRPMSGSASFGLIADVLKRYGPDSLIGHMASILHSSSDTTLFVLALYCGAVGIRNTRYALPVLLVGDAVGFAAAIIVAHLWPW
ncbi:MAG TPA: nucleoside recognition domain-containing protein [Limnochordia bacterium]|nr:nucleoside recognition domain-containing protein [Limnochordia bacterium]